jgi:hypothetical protein
VHVKNFFRRRRLAWPEITRVTWDYDPYERFVAVQNAAPRLRFEWGKRRDPSVRIGRRSALDLAAARHEADPRDPCARSGVRDPEHP